MLVESSPTTWIISPGMLVSHLHNWNHHAAGDQLLLIYVYAPSILLSYPAVRPDFCVSRAAKHMSEPTELQLEAYPADGEMQGEPPARRRRLRGKQVDHRNHFADDPVADRGHGELENEGANQNDGDIGVKPEGITMAQRGVLRKLHLNLGHPTAASLKRRLRTYGVSQHVLDAVDSIACRHCQELRRPATTRTATLTTSTEFNHNVFVDEFEVELSDGTKVLSMMILDDASSFRVAIPTANFSSISGSESKCCLHQGGFLWAGAPQNCITTWPKDTSRLSLRIRAMSSPWCCVRFQLRVLI